MADHKETYRIMGIDPGTNYMGYGIIEIEGRTMRSVVMGDIDLHTMSDPYRKLHYIFERVGKLIDDYEPREVALESPFFGTNVQSMLKLGRAQGVAMAAALHRQKEVFEYAPSRIKQAIAGSGSASKEQIAGVVMKTLHIETPPKKLDATDALGIAYCHYLQLGMPLREKGAKNWTTFAKQKGLVDKQLTGPNAKLQAAMQMAKKKK